MNAFQRWLPLTLFCLGSTAFASGAVSEQANLPANRLTRTVQGIRFEYSPGEDELVDALAAKAAAWNRDVADREAKWLASLETAPATLSARDLRAHRDEILRQLAVAMGLDEPTPLQVAVFNRMFKPYEDLEGTTEKLTEAIWHMSNLRYVTVWEKPELAARLKRGEKIAYFSWEPKTELVRFDYVPTFPPEAVAEKQKADEAVAQSQLESEFNYNLKDGVIDVGAGFTFKTGGDSQIKADPLPPRRTYNLVEPAESVPFPVVRKDTQAKLPVEQFADTAIKNVQSLLDDSGQSFRSGNLVIAHTIFHEVVEAGLVDRYIGSPDRRWFCEGIANYVAWKVIRDRAGADVARQAYDLQAQLASSAPLQRKVRLLRWVAAEKQRKEDKGSPLSKAHYAFATRAIFMMAETCGEDSVPKLLKEIGKTPRKQVDLKTVARCYRQTTGRRLDDLIRAAEKQPVAKPAQPAAPAPVAAPQKPAS